jgi:hypothetical protein
MIKVLIILIIFIGILFITTDIIRIQAGLIEKKPDVVYRFVPRTFEEEQLYPIYPSEIFETMFSQPSPWIVTTREYDRRKQEDINKYFITQL